jgi:hypothetical protein
MGNGDPLLWLQRNGYVTVIYFEQADAGSFSHRVATSFTFTLAQALWLTPMALTSRPLRNVAGLRSISRVCHFMRTIIPLNLLNLIGARHFG